MRRFLLSAVIGSRRVHCGLAAFGRTRFFFNSSWTHEKAGRTREALDYAERHLAASRGI